MNTRRLSCIGLLAATIIPAVSAAQAPDDRNGGFNLGAFVTDQDVTATFYGSSGGSDEVDLEDGLGLDPETTVFRLDGFWRFTGKHRLDFSTFDLSRDATGVVREEFTWEDVDYVLDIDVRTELDFAVYKLAYGYEFVQNDRGWFAGTAGLFVADMGLGLEILDTGSGTLESVTAPLPVLGIRGGYAMTDRWTATFSTELFFLEVDDISGYLYDLLATIDYSFTDTFGLGLGYNFVEMDVDGEASELEADFKWQYSGLLAYLKFSF